MSAYEQAREEIFLNSAQVRIYPLNLPDEPMGDWEWNVEITIPNNQWDNSDEDGNFVIDMGGLDAFNSVETAFGWAYKWLSGRGYDVSNLELVLNATAHAGIAKKSDYAKISEARKQNA
jgi:hypothetical protein